MSKSAVIFPPPPLLARALSAGMVLGCVAVWIGYMAGVPGLEIGGWIAAVGCVVAALLPALVGPSRGEAYAGFCARMVVAIVGSILWLGLLLVLSLVIWGYGVLVEDRAIDITQGARFLLLMTLTFFAYGLAPCALGREAKRSQPES